MGRGDLPDMYARAQGLQARWRVHTYQGKSRLHMLCNTFIVIVTILVG